MPPPLELAALLQLPTRHRCAPVRPQMAAFRHLLLAALLAACLSSIARAQSGTISASMSGSQQARSRRLPLLHACTAMQRWPQGADPPHLGATLGRPPRHRHPQTPPINTPAKGTFSGTVNGNSCKWTMDVCVLSIAQRRRTASLASRWGWQATPWQASLPLAPNPTPLPLDLFPYAVQTSPT